MKKSKILFAALATALLTLTGCNSGNSGSKPVSDAKTINVKLLLGGYGSEWMTQAISKFEAAYASEGYKINLINPNKQVTGNAVYADLLSGYSKKNIDIYFTGSLGVRRIAGEDGILVQSLDDLVYDQKAIGFDGKEEELTVREKLDSSFGEDWYMVDGKSYSFFYQRSIGGLVVNFDKLQKCGFNYLPVTTNQFLDMIHTITGNEKRVRPFSYVKNTGYAGVALENWFCQLAGLDKWNTFLSMNNADGSYNTTDGYNVFAYDEWIDAGEKVFNMFDYNNFVKGSKEYDIPRGHASLMTSYEDGGGVFIFDGDWALNETATDYPDQTDLEKLRFINVPMNSSVGTKLWGAGTELNITDEDKVDQILAKVVTLSDEGKSEAEIQTAVKNDAELGVTLSIDSIATVMEARGIYYNRGVETGNAVIPTGLSETHLDIASKFLRMIASDDFSRLYFKTAKCFSPYSNELDDDEELLPFSEGHKLIATHSYATGILPRMTGLRYEIGGVLERFFPNQTGYYHDVAIASEITAYNANMEIDPDKLVLYTNEARAESEAAISTCTSRWAEWVKPFMNN